MTKEELENLLEEHGLWLFGQGGSCANLNDADLRDADLSGANLSDASLNDANLRFASLRGANLRCANLSDANLSGANLRDADLRHLGSGNGLEVKTLQLGNYDVVVCCDKIFIGCKCYSPEEWKGFSDKRISSFDFKALEWWKKWKNFIFEVHATCKPELM